MTAPRPRSGFTLIELLVVIGIIAMLMALALPAVQRVREAAYQTTCRNNLHQIGIALHAHADAKGFLPPGYTFNGIVSPGTPVVYNTAPGWGWAAHLLPYIDQGPLFDQFDWEQPVEKKANEFGRTQIVPTYTCPSDRKTGVYKVLSHWNTSVGDAATNSYAACYGFGGRIGEYPTYGTGLFFRNSRFRLNEIPDGLSTTLAVGERAAFFCQGPWVGCLSDGTIRTDLDAPTYVFSIEETAVLVLARTSGITLNHDFAEPYDYYTPHPTVGHFLFADGSVRSLTPATPMTVWQAIGTRDGGETLPPGAEW